MPLPLASALLQETLRIMARRYRLPALSAHFAPQPHLNPHTALAWVIEQTRLALQQQQIPNSGLKRHFLDALAQLIEEALHPTQGDPVFQAQVLQFRSAPVRDYVALAAQRKHDQRTVFKRISHIAHPAKRQQMPTGPLRDALCQLYASATTAAWADVAQQVQTMLTLPEITESLQSTLLDLQDHPALAHLQDLERLNTDAHVQYYQSLRDRSGPRSGSEHALKRGRAAQRRGAAVEAVVSEALQVLAQRLNELEPNTGCYRVVTSMRVPASLPGSPERAKTEWDAVLLHGAIKQDEPMEWDVCLLIEAKASVDAASADLPRLRRGLHLLAQADTTTAYAFTTKQGVFKLRGASLNTLDPQQFNLANKVLYSSNAPSDSSPRLLSSASRMQLLSEPTSLHFASARLEFGVSQPELLEPLWPLLLSSPQLNAVLHQYPLLCEARDLMVHPDDLLLAVSNATLNL